MSLQEIPVLVVAKLAKADESLTGLVDNVGYRTCSYRAPWNCKERPTAKASITYRWIPRNLNLNMAFASSELQQETWHFSVCDSHHVFSVARNMKVSHSLLLKGFRRQAARQKTPARFVSVRCSSPCQFSGADGVVIVR